MGKRSNNRKKLGAQFAAATHAEETRKKRDDCCPSCGASLEFPEARIAEGQYHPSNLDAAREDYGWCKACGQIAHPGNRGHYGSLNVWGSWCCYDSCPACNAE